ncbi:MAG: SDR family oxidoreductase [Chloroflexota bacterium]|nr:SDR family oxidoreductase [Chloroflexota bacterium]
MQQTGSLVVVGGTSGLGKEVARHYTQQGHEVVISGRDAARAQEVALELGGRARGIAVDLARPQEIAACLADIAQVEGLVITAIERDANTVREYNIERAIQLSTIKLVGYTEVVHTLAPRFTRDASIVLFGGLAKERPYAGSTTVSTVNGGISGLTRTLMYELAPVRVNAIHPGIVGDSPFWAGKTKALEDVVARTPTRRLVQMRDVVGAVAFLLDNQAVNGVELAVDGGWVLY